MIYCISLQLTNIPGVCGSAPVLQQTKWSANVRALVALLVCPNNLRPSASSVRDSVKCGTEQFGHRLLGRVSVLQFHGVLCRQLCHAAAQLLRR